MKEIGTFICQVVPSLQKYLWQMRCEVFWKGVCFFLEIHSLWNPETGELISDRWLIFVLCNAVIYFMDCFTHSTLLPVCYFSLYFPHLCLLLLLSAWCQLWIRCFITLLFQVCSVFLVILGYILWWDYYNNAIVLTLCLCPSICSLCIYFALLYLFSV